MGNLSEVVNVLRRGGLFISGFCGLLDGERGVTFSDGADELREGFEGGDNPPGSGRAMKGEFVLCEGVGGGRRRGHFSAVP